MNQSNNSYFDSPLVAIWELTREFVESVQIPMVNRYLEMQKTPSSKILIDTLINKYIKEKEKADRDELTNLRNYCRRYNEGGTYSSDLSHSCLIHVKQYKTVIIDILQGKCEEGIQPLTEAPEGF